MADPLEEYSDELRLLATLLRDTIDPEDTNRDIENASIDWNDFKKLIRYHGIIGHFFHQRSELKALLPSSINRYISDRGRGNAGRSLKQLHVLGEVVSGLREHGIRCVPIKGPVLSKLLWGDYSRRTSSDLDLRVSHEEYSRAVSILEEFGFQLESNLSKLRGRLIQKLAHHATSMTRDDGIQIDLHWKFFAVPTFPNWSMDEILDRSQTVKAGGREIPCLGWEDRLKILSLHHAKHKWRRFGWLMDLKRLLEIRPEAEALRVVRWARGVGLSKRVLLGFWLVKRLFRQTLPGGVEEMVQTRGDALRGLEWAFQPLSADQKMEEVTDSPADFFSYLMEELRLHDSGGVLTAWRIIYGRTLRPWESDFFETPLARRLPLLANMRRFIRFLVKD